MYKKVHSVLVKFLLHITSSMWDYDLYSNTEAQQHTTSLWFYCELSKTKAAENHTALSHDPDHSVRLSAACPPHKDQSLSHPAPKRTIKHSCTSVCMQSESSRGRRYDSIHTGWSFKNDLKWFLYTQYVHCIFIIHCTATCQGSYPSKLQFLCHVHTIPDIFINKRLCFASFGTDFMVKWWSSLPSQSVTGKISKK